MSEITAVLWNELCLLKVRLLVFLSQKLSKIMVVNDILFIFVLLHVLYFQQGDLPFRHPEINALASSPVQVCFFVTDLPAGVTARVGMAASRSSDVWPVGVCDSSSPDTACTSSVGFAASARDILLFCPAVRLLRNRNSQILGVNSWTGKICQKGPPCTFCILTQVKQKVKRSSKSSVELIP